MRSGPGVMRRSSPAQETGESRETPSPSSQQTALFPTHSCSRARKTSAPMSRGVVCLAAGGSCSRARNERQPSRRVSFPGGGRVQKAKRPSSETWTHSDLPKAVRCLYSSSRSGVCRAFLWFGTAPARLARWTARGAHLLSAPIAPSMQAAVFSPTPGRRTSRFLSSSERKRRREADAALTPGEHRSLENRIACVSALIRALSSGGGANRL